MGQHDRRTVRVACVQTVEGGNNWRGRARHLAGNVRCDAHYLPTPEFGFGLAEDIGDHIRAVVVSRHREHGRRDGRDQVPRSGRPVVADIPADHNPVEGSACRDHP
jgi:hypothetical protein